MFASESIYFHFRNISEYLLPYMVASEVVYKHFWKDCREMFL